MQLSFHGIPLILHSDYAIEIPSERALIVADTHFGKSATFRASGLPVPEGDTARDLARLDCTLAETKAERLIIAGDFVHAAEYKSRAVLDLLTDWFVRQSVEFVIVPGNHDHRAGSIPRHWPCVWAQDYQLGAIKIIHDPVDATEGCPTLAGHLHPVVRVRHSRGRPLRLPCFWQRESLLVLPAFGSFTGGHPVAPTATDQVHAIVGDRVMTIPTDRQAP